jgi:hypothetical protein
MTAGAAVVGLPYYGDLARVDDDQAFLFEIVAPIESETVDEAVRQATAIAAAHVEEVRQEIQSIKIQGGGLVSGGGDLSRDRTLTVTAATGDVALAGTDSGTVITPATLALVLNHLFTTPGVLAGLLPTSLPDQAGLPWLDNGSVSISS